MATLTGLWHRLSKNLPLSQSADSLRGSRTRLRADFQFNVQKHPIADSSGTLWQRSLTQTLGWRVVRVAGSPQVVVHLLVLPTL